MTRTRTWLAVAGAVITVAVVVGCWQRVLNASTAPSHGGWSESAWQSTDLTAAAAAPAAVLSGLTGFVFETQRTQHVIYYSAPDNHVRELWWDANGRHASDLTAATGAPAASGGTLAGFVFDAQRSEHVLSVGADRHVYEMYWDKGWHLTDLTAATRAPFAAGVALIAYVSQTQGTEHVFYLGYDHHVYEMWWDNTWHLNDLTAATGAPSAGADALAGYIFESEGTEHVIYVGPGGHIFELWWTRQGWHFSDLTAATGSAAFGGGTLDGYMFSSQGTQHVIYKGVAGHVHELWSDGYGWHANDLTAATGAPNAAGGTIAAYAFESQATEHVIYAGVDRHLYELWWDNRWHVGDLTTATGAPAAAGATLAGYVSEAEGTEHVVYGSSIDAHIHELWWGPRVGHN
jgi:hypothetical protein